MSTKNLGLSDELELHEFIHLQPYIYTWLAIFTQMSKTLLNIVEAPFKMCWILMSVLYDEVQLDQ